MGFSTKISEELLHFSFFCFDFFIAGYMHTYLCNVSVCLSVCQGTTNQLNLLGNPENHYNSMVRMFSNCSVVLENLEVTYIQKHHSLAFLQVCNLTQLIRISACPHCDKSLLGLDLWKIKGQSGLSSTFSRNFVQTCLLHKRGLSHYFLSWWR